MVGGRRCLCWVPTQLPNAPYVLTDAIHLAQDVTRIHRPSVLLFAVLPLYAVFFAAGFACYVVALLRVSRYLRAEGRGSWAIPVEVALDALAAVGVFLGRFDRLNSWDMLARPWSVVSALARVAQHRPLAVVLSILAVVAVGKAAVVVVARLTVRGWRRVWALFGWPANAIRPDWA